MNHLSTRPTSYSSKLLPWFLALAFAGAGAWGTVEAVRLIAEKNYHDLLSLEAKRRAFEVTAQTLNGNVMGSAANLGLVNLAVKFRVRGEVGATDRVVLSTLEAVGRLYAATGVFVVGQNGIVASSWDSQGKPSTGLDIKFRPYFQIAMGGTQNVYAAVSLATGQRALYFAAPLYSAVSLESPVIGAAVARLSLDRVDSALRAWSGHALLLSPQAIAFASDRDDWVGKLARPATPAQLQSIRELKQFGTVFDTGTPELLPFDQSKSEVFVEGNRFGVASSSVQWNDPQGDWSLVLLGDLDSALPADQRLSWGLASGSVLLVLSFLFLFWRSRLRRAEASRLAAEADLKVSAAQLEADSTQKTFLVQVSATLHQAATVSEFSQAFLTLLMPRLPSNYALVYVLDDRSGTLLPTGSHGHELASLPAYRVGQGLVGQCVKLNQPQVIEASSPTEIRVEWGGGSLTPHAVHVRPLAHLDKALGVLVVATNRALSPSEDQLLDAMLPLVAMNLEILGRQSRSHGLVWGPQFQLGVASMDNEHQELVALLGSLADALDQGRDREVLDQLLGALVAYTATHFASEEGLMATHHYPETASHTTEHDELKRTALTLQADFRAGRAEVSVQTIHFLSNWLSHHILHIDRHLAEFLQGKETR